MTPSGHMPKTSTQLEWLGALQRLRLATPPAFIWPWARVITSSSKRSHSDQSTSWKAELADGVKSGQFRLLHGARKLTFTLRLYLITEFIIYPKKSVRSRTKSNTIEVMHPKPKHVGPAAPATALGVSLEGLAESASHTPSPAPTNGEEVKRAAVLRSRAPRDDGGVVCCLAVSEYCFKQGRVTVPPVSVAFSGRCDPI